MTAIRSLANLDNYRVMLASASPRRRELLSLIGVNFTLAPPIHIDETYPDDLPAINVAPFLAQVKADAYRTAMTPGELMITADTVVIAEGKVLGKPADEHEASAMLRQLSGRTHQVVTGVCVFTTTRLQTISAVTDVTFATLTEEEIADYITLYRPMDKAGAYGIQEWIGAIGVEGIRGSFYNVMGLPLHRLYTLLRTF